MRVEGDVAVVGITDFAQSELGDIVFVEVETEDETLEVDAVFGTIEAVKTVSDMFMPIAGTVIALNAELEDNPALINEDPYGAGWVIKIKLEEGADMDHLMSAEAYAAEVG